MNAIDSATVFFRSVATRSAATEIPDHLPTMIGACKAAGFDVVVVETPGIGQGDAAVVSVSDVSLCCTS
jgi:methylmalonyl-CoA mutase